ncbi:hypothetical protein RZN05_09050 [Sphingomonas sp. HF-S4]|uniref:Uncharacterized protein n=1 Tax=Sphingomonas agrestis TaxID=3080540 RepID=A0ABU3Y730_9SPHN|nr:hypothetical protein [Sphingomonas sp. HF-S4]MDV3457127.1 hypothetical protein [Sphingomonas sp. HF-S4]
MKLMVNKLSTLCRLAGAAAFAFTVTVGSSGSAQEAPPPVAAASFRDALNRATGDLSAGKLPEARAGFEALLKRPLGTSERGIALAMRAVTLVGLGELDAAARGFSEARLAAPHIPDVQLAEVRAGLAFGRPGFVLQPLTRIAEAHGEWLTLEHRELVTSALAMGVQGKLRKEYEALVLALGRRNPPYG